ncbi:MAG: CAP domain-containing protein [Syntrophorhabdaceae bacterium]
MHSFGFIVLLILVFAPGNHNYLWSQEDRPGNLGAGYSLIAAQNEKKKEPAVQEGNERETITGEELLRLTNKVRRQHKLSPLREDPVLKEIAAARVDDMFEKQYFGHISPAGEDPSDIAKEKGYFFQRIGENLAEGQFSTNQRVVAAWMNSSGHRKNLLSKDFTEIGIAVKRGDFKGENSIIAIQIFGKPWP